MVCGHNPSDHFIDNHNPAWTLGLVDSHVKKKVTYIPSAYLSIKCHTEYFP